MYDAKFQTTNSTTQVMYTCVHLSTNSTIHLSSCATMNAAYGYGISVKVATARIRQGTLSTRKVEFRIYVAHGL